MHSVFFAGKPGNTPGFPDGGDSPGGDVTMRWLTRTPGTLGNRVHIGVYLQFCAVVCCSMLIIERKRMLESENETNTTIHNYRRGFWRELSAIDGCWKWKFCKMRKLKAYSTRYSQAVTHPSTNRARRCLTSVIGREPVRSTWYGRRHYRRFMSQHLYSHITVGLVKRVKVMVELDLAENNHSFIHSFMIHIIIACFLVSNTLVYCKFEMSAYWNAVHSTSTCYMWRTRVVVCMANLPPRLQQYKCLQQLLRNTFIWSA